MPFALAATMPSPKKPAAKSSATPDAPLPGLPSPRVMKLQMLGAVVLPMLLAGFWLHRQGFW